MNEGRPGVRLECPKSLLDISISAETTRGPHSLLGAGPWGYGADTARGHGVQECLIAATRPSTRHKYLNLTNYLSGGDVVCRITPTAFRDVAAIDRADGLRHFCDLGGFYADMFSFKFSHLL